MYISSQLSYVSSAVIFNGSHVASSSGISVGEWSVHDAANGNISCITLQAVVNFTLMYNKTGETVGYESIYNEFSVLFRQFALYISIISLKQSVFIYITRMVKLLEVFTYSECLLLRAPVGPVCVEIPNHSRKCKPLQKLIPVTIDVPSDAAVDRNQSSCNGPNEPSFAVQILRLNFWGTWWCEFHFSRNTNRSATGSQSNVNLFQVIVFADYAANQTQFPHPTRESFLTVMNHR